LVQVLNETKDVFERLKVRWKKIEKPVDGIGKIP
jgi:hypothetical protein